MVVLVRGVGALILDVPTIQIQWGSSLLVIDNRLLSDTTSQIKQSDDL